MTEKRGRQKAAQVGTVAGLPPPELDGNCRPVSLALLDHVATRGTRKLSQRVASPACAVSKGAAGSSGALRKSRSILSTEGGLSQRRQVTDNA